MSITGDWKLDIDSPAGRQDIVASFQENDCVLTGIVTNRTSKSVSDIFDGSVSGDTLEWKIRLQPMRLVFAFSTKVEGDTLSGKVKMGLLGKFNVTGKRER
jgi:hypothetical protein